MRRLRDRLPRVSLRWRLAGWVTVVVLLCTGISFVAVYRGTGTQVRQQIDKEISGGAGDLAQDLALSKSATPAQVSRAANSYVRDQSFAASSTVLFTLVPGAATSTNRPELFSQPAPDGNETAALQGQENRLARDLLTAPDGYSTLSLTRSRQVARAQAPSATAQRAAGESDPSAAEVRRVEYLVKRRSPA